MNPSAGGRDDLWQKLRSDNESDVDAGDAATMPPRIPAEEQATIAGPTADQAGRACEESKPPARVFAGSSSAKSRFGDFELLEEVSRGGMGVVYRAKELRLNRIVALKMILAGELAGVDEVRRFHAEAEAAAQLAHPGIVPIYETGSVGSQHFYTMSFVEGAGLDQFKDQGISDHARAARIVQLVSEAVDFAHQHGIVHRDLKPANVLLDAEGVPHITDFGLAKRTDSACDLTRTGQILGTPGYMSPEQAAGESKVIGAPADIYSLGALLYFVLTGRPPFQAANVIDTLVQSLESEPTMPRKLNPAIPRALEQICMRCLERNPADRYSSAGDVARDLDRFLQGQPVHAQAPTLPERLRRLARRAPVLCVHLVALVLIALVAQLRYMTSDGPDFRLHMMVEGALLLWIGISIALHGLARNDASRRIPGTILLCVDAAMLSVLLILMTSPDSPPGPLLIGYPLIIVGGALFFDARRVMLVTIAAITSYLALLWAEPTLIQPVHYHVCFLIMLLAIAGCLIHQVKRVKTLSDYFESRR